MSKEYNLPKIVSLLTLDRLELTKKAVDSVLEESTEDVRMVFLDNGSQDGTLEYLSDLNKKYSNRVTFLRSDTNLGIAGGRNRIFRHIISNYGTKFGWVLSLDNDCMVHSGYDKSITNAIKETGALAVCPRLIQPDGRMFYNAYSGFLIDLNNMRLKLEYGDDISMKFDNPKFSNRLETDIILGTSAKTPSFFEKVGFYDQGHKVGWEDFSIALKALNLKKESFLRWKEEKRHGEKEWVPLRTLMGEDYSPLAKVIYEPDCIITHDHPVTEKHQAYEKVRWNPKTIQESTDHFENVWGLRPVL